jgi:hypothetical protein
LAIPTDVGQDRADTGTFALDEWSLTSTGSRETVSADRLGQILDSTPVIVNWSRESSRCHDSSY